MLPPSPRSLSSRLLAHNTVSDPHEDLARDEDGSGGASTVAGSELELARRAAVKAIKRGLDAALRTQLKANPEVASAVDAHTGRNLLHYTGYCGRPSFARAILREVPDPQQRRELLQARGGALAETPLHVAARRDCGKSLVQLLQDGADPEAEDARGCTPLVAAAQHEKWGACCLLLASGADVNATDADSRTALTWVCRHAPKNLPLVWLLLRFGADGLAAAATAARTIVAGRARPLLLDSLSLADGGGASYLASPALLAAATAAESTINKKAKTIISANSPDNSTWFGWCKGWVLELKWRARCADDHRTSSPCLSVYVSGVARLLVCLTIYFPPPRPIIAGHRCR